MSLSTLVGLLHEHQVTLTLTEGDMLLPTAPAAPPENVIQGIREQRHVLIRRLQRGQTAEGQLCHVPQAGECGTCSSWSALPAAHMGLCRAGRRAHGWYDGDPQQGVEIHVRHRCAAYGGTGWRLRGTT